jgi:hypothetical protein
MLMFNYLFLSETYETVARDTCPSLELADELEWTRKWGLVLRVDQEKWSVFKTDKQKKNKK